MNRPLQILIACIHYPVASGRYIQRALKRLGHDVRTVGPYTGNMIWNMAVKEEWVWKPDISWPQTARMDEPLWRVLYGVRPWEPDLIVSADSAFALTDSDKAYPHIVWGVDNHVRDYRLREFDALFLAHSWGARMGESSVHWLPCAYDPEAHCDIGLDRDIDVLMVGVAYQSRIEILQALSAAGINAAGVTGALWGDYNLLYNRAKIALVKSACGDLAQRFFENMAQGCCVLADKTLDADKLGFEPGVDYIAYDNADDATQKARWLLTSGEWRSIAANGKRKVREHTWDNRALKLLETVRAPEAGIE